ncbi:MULTISPECIES: hypothetical protein [unclassified Fusibacter]|uniref:hypothetical protein n=1 Tax=unclassified Fusibacter TaxID=2624464 RepID=UPI001012AB9A|nr:MULTISPECIES: hypothetical protein [unclassified Fusibacter]MCK8060096.1 hypothetical protein [Fusibacter sp. A2]NPE22238.1 hypothetical protein [Fusibacter sp. A1]RXV61012.1 hypothetical protein DWB64_10360 [Fusibacter sp. A1]
MKRIMQIILLALLFVSLLYAVANLFKTDVSKRYLYINERFPIENVDTLIGEVEDFRRISDLEATKRLSVKEHKDLIRFYEAVHTWDQKLKEMSAISITENDLKMYDDLQADSIKSIQLIDDFFRIRFSTNVKTLNPFIQVSEFEIRMDDFYTEELLCIIENYFKSNKEVMKLMIKYRFKPNKGI